MVSPIVNNSRVPWIKNYDMASVYNGYLLAKDEDVKTSNGLTLIQIFDIASTRNPPYDLIKSGRFDHFESFEFLDIDPGMEGFGECSITADIAKKINFALVRAKFWNTSVIVHCFAGVARSGSVVERAIEMGFEDKGIYRNPNPHVLEMLRNG